MRSIAAVLCFVMALILSPAHGAEECVILLLGDSLSAAHGMERSEAWPALLADRLTEDGYPCRVFNSSITGDTTEGGRTRLKRNLEMQRPAIVVIELGGNDGLRGLSLEVTEVNLAAMIRQSLDHGARVVLAGVRLPPNYGRSYTERFDAMYRRLATEFDVVHIPFILEGIALDPQLMQDDGIHPNVRAQPRILEIVWQALQPLLPRS